MANKQEYTGTFIPAYIMLDGDLKMTERMLYAEVASFQDCYVSNTWFASRMGVSVRTVQNALATLEEKGYVIRTEIEKKRHIVALHLDPRKNCMGGMQNLHGGGAKSAPIDKHKNNKEKTASATPPADLPLAAEKTSDGQQATPPTTLALLYRVIKKYGLPVRNHTHVPKKAKAMDEEIGADAAQAYLSTLLETDYNSINGDFKPTLNDGLDVYNKRVAIQTFLQSNGVRRVLPNGEQRDYHGPATKPKKDWGF